MSLRWLKPYVPRSLYWRATLLLLLPVVTLLLVVSIVFIQRHFEGVTQQMTETVNREILAVLGDGTRPPEALINQPVARTLNINLSVIPQAEIPESDFRRWYDFSGVVVIREFKKAFPDLKVVELTDDSAVRLYFLRDGQGIKLVFDRRRVRRASLTNSW